MEDMRNFNSFIKGCVVVLILEVASSNGESSYISSYNIDLQPLESLLWTTHGTRSLIECSAHCETDKSCLAYSLNASSCQGYSDFLRIHSNPSPESALVYRKKYTCEGVGYTPYPPIRVCLKFYPKNATRTSAKEICRRDGGRLARIDSAQKHNYIRNVLKADSNTKDRMHIHVDGETKTNNDWKYADGTAVSYFDWAPTLPDNNEHNLCLYLLLAAWLPSDLEFDDFFCDTYKYFFLCENIEL